MVQISLADLAGRDLDSASADYGSGQQVAAVRETSARSLLRLRLQYEISEQWGWWRQKLFVAS